MLPDGLVWPWASFGDTRFELSLRGGIGCGIFRQKLPAVNPVLMEPEVVDLERHKARGLEVNLQVVAQFPQEAIQVPDVRKIAPQHQTPLA